MNLRMEVLGKRVCLQMWGLLILCTACPSAQQRATEHLLCDVCSFKCWLTVMKRTYKIFSFREFIKEERKEKRKLVCEEISDHG